MGMAATASEVTMSVAAAATEMAVDTVVGTAAAVGGVAAAASEAAWGLLALFLL